MQVIGAGFGRTGTASMKAALDHLGFGPCYHMYELLAQPQRVHDWWSALGGESVDWRRVFGGYASTMDWPGCAVYRELMGIYPEAKVILTERDPDRWYDSTFSTIYQIGTSEADDGDAAIDLLRPMIRKMIWDGDFGGRFADRDYAIEVFNQHNEDVKRNVPADRLLVFEVSDGWKPLCDFLEVPVPPEDFPYVNDKGTMAELIAQIRTEGRFPSPFAAA